MKITYLGHATVLIQGSKSIIIDPFLTNNPLASLKPSQLPHIDFVLITHDHFDHIGDAIEIAKSNNSTIVAIHEIATMAEVTKENITSVGMNIGGTYQVDDIRISMTNAIHSANLGSPVGFVIEIDGYRFYHAGDTALFSDMALIPKLFGKLDVAFLPIGGQYVMDVKQASMATDLLQPKIMVPIHYNTWPIIKADPDELIRLAKDANIKILLPGEEMVL